jgi:hypothetical protein
MEKPFCLFCAELLGRKDPGEFTSCSKQSTRMLYIVEGNNQVKQSAIDTENVEVCHENVPRLASWSMAA